LNLTSLTRQGGKKVTKKKQTNVPLDCGARGDCITQSPMKLRFRFYKSSLRSYGSLWEARSYRSFFALRFSTEFERSHARAFSKNKIFRQAVPFAPG